MLRPLAVERVTYPDTVFPFTRTAAGMEKNVSAVGAMRHTFRTFPSAHMALPAMLMPHGIRVVKLVPFA